MHCRSEHTVGGGKDGARKEGVRRRDSQPGAGLERWGTTPMCLPGEGRDLNCLRFRSKMEVWSLSKSRGHSTGKEPVNSEQPEPSVRT